MVDELKTKITVDADQAQRELNETSTAERKLAGETAQAGRAASKTSGELGQMQGVTGSLRRGIGGLLGSVRGLVGGLIGVGGLVAAWRANRREMEENLRLIRELADAQRDLLFLASGNTGAELGAIKDAAEIVGGEGGRVELTRTFAQLKSQTADLSEEARLALFQQLVETSLATAAKPTELVELFSKGSRFESDPQVLQNIIAQTIRDNPESSPASIGRLLPQLFPVGQAAGLSAAETAGAFSFAAGVAGTPEQGATGLRNIILAMRGRGTPESREILERFGATPDLNFFSQINALSAGSASGELDLPALETIGGRENTALLSALLRGRADLNANVRRAVSASTGEDITRIQLERTLEEFSIQNIDLLTRQGEGRVESLRLGDENAQLVGLGRILLEEQLRGEGQSTVKREANLLLFDALTGFGINPGLSAGLVDNADVGVPSVAQGLRGRSNLDVNAIGRPANVTIIQGTQINHGRDPRRDDLVEGRPQN